MAPTGYARLREDVEVSGETPNKAAKLANIAPTAVLQYLCDKDQEVPINLAGLRTALKGCEDKLDMKVQRLDKSLKCYGFEGDAAITVLCRRVCESASSVEDRDLPAMVEALVMACPAALLASGEPWRSGKIVREISSGLFVFKDGIGNEVYDVRREWLRSDAASSVGQRDDWRPVAGDSVELLQPVSSPNTALHQLCRGHQLPQAALSRAIMGVLDGLEKLGRGQIGSLFDGMQPGALPEFESAPPPLLSYCGGAAPAIEEQRTYRQLTLEGAASSSWTALDGNHVKDGKHVGFADQAYSAMRDDAGRTPLYARAITARLAEAAPKTLSVLDIGTGPHAVLALLAAQAGARRVFAVEMDAEAASRARETVRAAGWGEVIEVLVGLSTDLTLPEKVDVVVSEIVGSVASEEGVFATIQDAHARLVKEPTACRSWIPCRVETWGAPCSYALHHALGAPAYAWSGIDEPLRLACHDRGLLTLAPPQLLEAISFHEIHELQSGSGSDGGGGATADVAFEITEERLTRNSESYLASLLAEGCSAKAASLHASQAASGLSGLAMWPRLVLRQGSPHGAGGEEEIVVESRGIAAHDAHGDSHWQTVLPVLAGRPVTVEAGQLVRVRSHAELPSDVDVPVAYSIEYS